MDNLIGKTLDGLYTVRELIGTGGMANVYKAVVGPGGPVPEGTVVAVKVFHIQAMLPLYTKLPPCTVSIFSSYCLLSFHFYQ